jgi:hypothetical protein
VLFTVDVRDQKQQIVVRHAERLPAVFAAFDPILLGQGEWICEGAHGKFEADAMLPQIAFRLRSVPFKAQTATPM